MTRIGNLVDQALDMSRRARMQRAREMGFSTPEFRGTKGDQVEFYTADRGKTRGTGVWTSDSPATASSYAPNIEEGAVYPLLTDTSRHARINASGANWNSIETRGLTAKLPNGDEVLVSDLFPEEIEPGTMTSTDELAQLFRQRGMEDGVVFESVVDVGPNFGSYKYAEEYLRNKGYDFQFPLGDPRVPQEDQIAAMRYAETREPGVANTTVHFQPQNIRSVNAAFDPAQRDSSNLLAGVGGAAVGAGLLGAGVAPQEAEAALFGTLRKIATPAMREKLSGYGVEINDIGQLIDIENGGPADLERVKTLLEEEAAILGPGASEADAMYAVRLLDEARDAGIDVDPDGSLRAQARARYEGSLEERGELMELNPEDPALLKKPSAAERKRLWNEIGELGERISVLRRKAESDPEAAEELRRARTYQKRLEERATGMSPGALGAASAAAVGAGLLAPQEAEAAPFGTLARQLGRRTREAWHGSPYVYDQVDLSRMGTGEGAQAYGAGYYAAERRGVADEYRRQLSGTQRFDGEPYNIDDPRHVAAYWVDHFNGDRDRALRYLEQGNEALRELGQEVNTGPADVLRRGEPLPDVTTPEGALYRLEIPDEGLLDWDAPLSEQPAAVRAGIERLRQRRDDLTAQYQASREANAQAAVSRDMEALEQTAAKGRALQAELASLPELPSGDVVGRDLYLALARNNSLPGVQPPGQGAASAVLASVGIPGIRYLDGASRDAGEGTRNYVIFDDANVNVVQRNGEPIAAMPRGREEPMSAAAGFARPGAMAATGAAGALASFLDMRSGKQDTPYKRFIAEGQRAVEQAIGAGENIGNLAASILAEPIAGYAGLVAGPEAVQRTRDYFAPQSMSPAAQQQMIGLGNTLESAGQQIMSGLDVAGQAVGVDRLSDYARYAPGYWAERAVPALQQQFGTQAGSVVGAALRTSPEALSMLSLRPTSAIFRATRAAREAL